MHAAQEKRLGLLNANHERKFARCEGGGVEFTNGKRLEAVLNALRRAGVEIEDDGLRLLKRRGR
jgi:hypothetical protein